MSAVAMEVQAATRTDAAAPPRHRGKITIIYATVTGTALEVSEEIARQAKRKRYK